MPGVRFHCLFLLRNDSVSGAISSLDFWIHFDPTISSLNCGCHRGPFVSPSTSPFRRHLFHDFPLFRLMFKAEPWDVKGTNTVDGRNPAPPKKPWKLVIPPVNAK